MAPEESKSYQLRVRVTAEERDLLERLRTERNRGETISDLVREAIAMLTRPNAEGSGASVLSLSPAVRAQVDELAVLLKREPHQVEEACVEGILDLIEHRSEVPLIVMEAFLHRKYKGRDDKVEADAPKNANSDGAEMAPAPAPAEKAAMKLA